MASFSSDSGPYPEPAEYNLGSRGAGRTVTGLYLHIPFCTRKCDYCAFHSVVGAGGPGQAAVVDAMRRHLEDAEPEAKNARTLYLGGGTPSVLEPGQIASLLALARDVAPGISEITVEANPESCSPAFLDVLAGYHGSRLSLGVQSLDTDACKWLGRNPTSRKRVSEIRRQWPGSLSADLIFGFPAHAGANTIEDIRTLHELGVEHFSIYELSLEPDTPIVRRVTAKPAQDERLEDSWAAMLDLVEELGFERYEVSNFARPGHRCSHNVGYWSYEPYLGIGPSAVSTLWDAEKLIRITQPSDHDVFIRSPGFRTGWAEPVSVSDQLLEFLMLGLRMADGIEFSRFAERFGDDLRRMAPGSLAKHAESGLLLVDPVKVAPTSMGMDLLNVVLHDLVNDVTGGPIS